MQTVNFISDVNYTRGTIGFSMLYSNFLDGGADQKTVLFLRDSEGYLSNVLLVPAAAVRGNF